MYYQYDYNCKIIWSENNEFNYDLNHLISIIKYIFSLVYCLLILNILLLYITFKIEMAMNETTNMIFECQMEFKFILRSASGGVVVLDPLSVHWYFAMK